MPEVEGSLLSGGVGKATDSAGAGGGPSAAFDDSSNGLARAIVRGLGLVTEGAAGGGADEGEAGGRCVGALGAIGDEAFGGGGGGGGGA